MNINEMINLAKEAMENAYAPYSNYKVGAVLVTKDGKTYTGCVNPNSPSTFYENVEYEYKNEKYGTLEGVWQYTAYSYKFTNGYGTKYFLESRYFCIPSSIKNVTITVQTDIPVAAFNNCDFIETITLSPDVENIGDYAFQNCNATIQYA